MPVYSPKISYIIGVIRICSLIILIAFADWLVNANVPLGLLYLFPIALAGSLLPRLQVSLLAAACAGLAETFDGFTWNFQTGIPRDLLYLAAFSGLGLFVNETLTNRRKSAFHMKELETEIQARRDAEEQLRILIKSSPIAVLTTDSAGTVLLANDAACRLLAVEPGRLEGKLIDIYLPALTSVPAFRGGETSFRTVMQCRGQRQGGEAFLAEIWFSTYLTSAGPRLAAMVLDTSQNLRDQEEANLHHLLEGSRILVRAVSHEVRNVCGAIAVVHQNIANSGILRGNRDFEGLGTLVLALERIASLDLQQTAERPTSLDLHAFFEELRVILGSIFREKGIEDHWDVQSDLPTVWADRQSLMQVLLNLTRNSEKAMENQPFRALAVKADVVNGHVRVSVIDNGRGVEEPSFLFKPFQQKSRQIALGLFLSRALVRAFGGDLRYEPTVQGATFVVDLLPVREVSDGIG